MRGVEFPLYLYIYNIENGILIRSHIFMKNSPEMANQWVLIAFDWLRLALIYDPRLPACLCYSQAPSPTGQLAVG